MGFGRAVLILPRVSCDPLLIAKDVSEWPLRLVEERRWSWEFASYVAKFWGRQRSHMMS